MKYRKETGHISYDSFKYDNWKSYMNRVARGKEDAEFNDGFGSKYYNINIIGKARLNRDFKNWNGSIMNGYRPQHGKVFRRIVYQTVAQTFQQDQILRDMIENREHLNTENIVAIDVEYGGGKTVPRVGIVNFNEESIYYSDFCLRYNDWDETKRLMREKREKGEKLAQKALDRHRLESDKNLEKIAREEYYASKNKAPTPSSKPVKNPVSKNYDTDGDEDVDELENEFDKQFDTEVKDAKDKVADYSISKDGHKIYADKEKHDRNTESANLSIQELFSESKKQRHRSGFDNQA